MMGHFIQRFVLAAVASPRRAGSLTAMMFMLVLGATTFSDLPARAAGGAPYHARRGVIAPAQEVQQPQGSRGSGEAQDSAVASAAATDGRFDDAVRMLRQATQVYQSSTQSSLLKALRQLKDPDLKPLFSSLSQQRQPVSQINGILGLAECQPGTMVDPWKLSQITDSRLRILAIMEAEDRNLIGTDELKQILAWSDIKDSLKAYVLAMLASKGEKVDAAALTDLAARGDSPVNRALASLTLMHLHDPETQAPEAIKAIDALPALNRESAIAELIMSIGHLKMTGTQDWLKAIIADQTLRRSTRNLATRALLEIDPGAGLSSWQAQYARAGPELASRITLALTLLDYATRVPPEAFAGIKSDPVELIRDIGRAGEEAAGKSGKTHYALALIRQHHAPSDAWVYRYATQEGQPIKGDLLAALIEDTFVDGPSLDDRLDIASLASTSLIDADPDQLKGILDKGLTSRQRLPVEAILVGLMNSNSKNIGPLVEKTDVYFSNRIMSLALILKAEHNGKLTDTELDRLATAFRGGGSISPPEEAVAAWEYLKITGQDGTALAAILAGLSPAALPEGSETLKNHQ